MKKWSYDFDFNLEIICSRVLFKKPKFWSLYWNTHCANSNWARSLKITYANCAPLSSLTIIYQFDWTRDGGLFIRNPRVFKLKSSKGNVQKVEFVVFDIKWKLFIQLRSGSLFGKSSRRGYLFTGNQVSDMAAMPDEIHWNTSEIF